jgi:hypothetical protein
MPSKESIKILKKYPENNVSLKKMLNINILYFLFIDKMCRLDKPYM